jgi:hypothetical protein
VQSQRRRSGATPPKGSPGQESLPNPFTVRDVMKKGWDDLRASDDVDHAFGILKEHGW